MVEDTMRELYGRWLKELWNGDLSVASEIVSSGFTIHHGPIQPGGEMEMTGPDGIANLISMSRQCFDDLTFEPEVGPIVQDGLISARWTGRGKYKGGFPGATAEPGTEIVFRGNDILQFADGRFVEYWVCSDGQYLNQQLGVA